MCPIGKHDCDKRTLWNFYNVLNLCTGFVAVLNEFLTSGSPSHYAAMGSVKDFLKQMLGKQTLTCKYTVI